MILTVNTLDEVSPTRRVQEYHQIAYKAARAVKEGEYRSIHDAIETMTARMRLILSADDFEAIQNIAVRIR